MSDQPDPFVIRGGVFTDPRAVLDVVQDALDDGDGAVLSVYVGRVAIGESHDQAVHRVAVEATCRTGRPVSPPSIAW